MSNTTIKDNWKPMLEKGNQTEKELIILLKQVDIDTHKDKEGNYKWNDIVMPTRGQQLMTCNDGSWITTLQECTFYGY